MTVEAKDVDSYGRIVLPKPWRGRKVWVLDKGDELKVIPRPTSKLTDFFDEARIDVREFSDYRKLKAEIEGRRLGAKR
jgi:bifunctional DNA-binding transcriptional regulator/antitoxin component of YhaV-PrlF toxin-antitoxin module